MAVDQTQLKNLKDIIGLETLVRVKQSYVDDSQTKLATLKQAVSDSNLKEVDELSHSLKSASANLALASLASVFAEMELNASKGNAELLPALYEQAVSEYESSLAELESLL